MFLSSVTCIFLSSFLNKFFLFKLFTGVQETININKQITMINKLDIGLYIISTPIGNLEDISLRAKRILNMVDIIICENPVHSLKLLNNLGIKKKLLSLHDYNEEFLIKRIEKNQINSSIALISDAGSPLISDPGYKLVLDYIKKNIMITSIPGPTSITTALQLSGIPSNNFTFFGFIPKNKSAILSIIAKIEKTTSTSVFFISGLRLLSFLEELSQKKINRNIAICKELTKKNERVFRGTPSKILFEKTLNKMALKGEFVIIIEGLKKNSDKRLDLKHELQIKKLLNKFSLTEVVEIVHKLTNISKKEIYKTTLIIKND